MRENDLILMGSAVDSRFKGLKLTKNPALLKVSVSLPRSKVRYKTESETLGPIVQGLLAYIRFGFLSVLDYLRKNQ